jgi:hypothetical protein
MKECFMWIGNNESGHVEDGENNENEEGLIPSGALKPVEVIAISADTDVTERNRMPSSKSFPGDADHDVSTPNVLG